MQHLATFAAVARWLLLIAAIAITATPRVAFAHAHLVRSSPAANSHVSSSPTLLQLWFSEAAEATMTTITVTGVNGQRITIGPMKVDATDPLLIAGEFSSAMAPGTYTVDWRTVAKDDGHPSSGKFSFVVDSGAAMAIAPTVPGAQDSVQPTAELGAGITSTSVDAMDVESATYVLARWLNFISLVAIIGVIAFRFLVLPRVTQKVDTGDSQPEAGSGRGDSFANLSSQRAATLGLLASVAVLVAAVWRLYAERAVVGGGISLTTVLHSNWGKVWHVQLAAALVALIAFALARRSRQASGPAAPAAAWIVAGLAVVILGASSAFSGHAMAAPQWRNTAVLLDILHVLAAGGWLGGLLAVAVVGVPVAMSISSDQDPAERMPLVARVVNAFSPTALTFAGTVVVTGGLAAKMRIGSWTALFHSNYGVVLLVKLGFVLLVIAGGAFNWRRMRVALSQPTGESAVSKFRGSAWLELTAGILVLVVTAVLVATQPPIH